MRKILFLSITACFLLSPHAFSQPPCGFDIVHNNLLASDPGYAARVERDNAAIRQYIQAHPALTIPSSSRTMATLTIPVVVHVMHTGGAIGTIYNPSDAQITGAITYLNQVYAGTLSGMTAPSAGGAAGDMNVQFALAKRTPSCGATTGIDRVDASSLPNYTANGVNASNSTGCPELTLKDFDRWNTADYYNIWVVNKIDGADGTSGQFIAGFAYFPGSSASYDGTIMLATQMAANAKTLPHEIGHALNIYHTFQGSANTAQCPPNTSSPNCFSDGDLCCDTDPVSSNNVSGVYNFTCRTGNNTCTSTPGPVRAYSINTESNYMAYTNCYTLFTNDQKARAQAALTLPSRASLVSGTNMALIPCGTVINFSAASATVAETAGTTVGCRTYTDYNYQMVVGTGPSAASNATLTYSGTAIKGIDYDVTTNGNFASQSNVLSFAALATVSQSFTVRIYNDADVESNETIILNFTVANGGGNAAKGTTAPTLTITIGDNDLAPTGTSSGTYSSGALTYFITDAPFEATQQSQRVQLLYKATELTTAGLVAGNITALQLYVFTKLSTRSFGNYTIKMANTPLTYLASPGLQVVGGMTTVYTAASYASIAGWNNFTLLTPFAWDGTSSLAIEICYDNGTAAPGDAADELGIYSDGGSASQSNMFWQNGINCSGSFSTVGLYYNGLKPIIKLSTSVTGTPIETATVGSTGSNFIGVGSGDYFYSGNNKLLMRLSNVNASLGCVNVGLDNQGTTWVSYMGGQRSAKVFAATPTTNVATTNYTASFYFDNVELGGKNPLTLKLAKTTAGSAAASTGANTIRITPVVTTLGSSTTVFTASFTGFSRFFLVDAAVVLPVSLLDFSGSLNAQENAALTWSTSAELDNRQFDVELSRDAINFVLLGTVNSRGNSNTIQQYEFLHIKPQPGLNWYRLKQIDRDGHASYSRVISINVNKGGVKAFLYPVPANDVVTVNFGSIISHGEITLLTADMKTISKEAINNLSIKKDIDISTLPHGIYFIRLTGNDNSNVLRFIKE